MRREVLQLGEELGTSGPRKPLVYERESDLPVLAEHLSEVLLALLWGAFTDDLVMTGIAREELLCDTTQVIRVIVDDQDHGFERVGGQRGYSMVCGDDSKRDKAPAPG
jgi:hypothetical protein